ncbi:hypothetical protein LCGC14_0384390 [marine sediment metagenome]|uniref:Uncharacterized protein n=1 Tax=marine sediment metagenome TaxID=412755 RepID=A0A0F9T1A8_9ZZZZ
MAEGMQPFNTILFDMATEHRKIVHGAFYQAIREITGRKPSQVEMARFAGIDTPDHMNWADYVYKGTVILRVFVPEITRNPFTGKVMKVHQKIHEVWRTGGQHRRP